MPKVKQRKPSPGELYNQAHPDPYYNKYKNRQRSNVRQLKRQKKVEQA